MNLKCRSGKKSCQGFTLVEMSIVLVVIGLILGAVSIGKDLQRNAQYQKISSQFVQGWAQAYHNYFQRTGIVLGDNPASPTLRVDGASGTPGEICGATLFGLMDAAGINMPDGRAEGVEDRAVYLDTNGNPQEIRVCFSNVDWSIPGATSGYVVRKRNVMIIYSLTPDFARFLDAQIDGNSDARFGAFRESTQAGSTVVASQQWSLDNRRAFGTSTDTNQDESQVAVLIGYYLMDN